LLKTVCLESDFLTADEIAFSKRVAILSSSELLSLVDKLLAKSQLQNRFSRTS